MMSEQMTTQDNIYTKDGLLWRNGQIIELPLADLVAREHGHDCAERFVKHLEGLKCQEK
jgi:hypothetical protein